MGGIAWKSAVESSLLVLIIPCQVRTQKCDCNRSFYSRNLGIPRRSSSSFYSLVLLVSEFGLKDNGSVSLFQFMPLRCVPVWYVVVRAFHGLFYKKKIDIFNRIKTNLLF